MIDPSPRHRTRRLRTRAGPRTARAYARTRTMWCSSSKPTSASDDADAHEEEFFDASEALLALPSFMRAKSLERLSSTSARESARSANGGVMGSLRSASMRKPRASPDSAASGMSKCVVPVFERGLETLADETGTASWSPNPRGVGFKLRGKTYKRDRKKIASGAPFYETKAVLAFKADEKVGDWIKNLFADDLGRKIRDQVPTVLIANIMVPDYKPTGGMFKKGEDNNGPGHNVVLLCKLSDFARKTFEETANWDNLPADYKLLLRYLKGDGTGRVDTHPHIMVRQQTKMVVMVVSGHENLPWVVRTAVNHGNGKPFMVNKTSSYIERSGAIEINIDAHNFSNMALNGLRTVHTSLGKLILDVGATVQGENEEELPERLLFSCRVNYAKIELIEAHVDMIEVNPEDRVWLPPIKAALS